MIEGKKKSVRGKKEKEKTTLKNDEMKKKPKEKRKVEK